MQKHTSYLISSTVLSWLAYFPVKKIPSLCKIEVEKFHSIWLSSAGTHQREPDVEGLTAGRYGWLAHRSAKCQRLASLEKKFCTGKSWFSNYDILLLLMLLTPEKRCSITVNTTTVWAFLNPCCSLKVVLQNYQKHPAVPVEVQNETLSYINL